MREQASRVPGDFYGALISELQNSTGEFMQGIPNLCGLAKT